MDHLIQARRPHPVLIIKKERSCPRVDFFRRWTREEFKNWDRKSRRLVAIHKSLYSKEVLDDCKEKEKRKEEKICQHRGLHQFSNNGHVYTKEKKERLIISTKSYHTTDRRTIEY